MSEITIEVEKREVTGKNANRRLRARGLIPAIVYGGGKDAVPIQVDRKAIHELLRQEGGANAIFLLKLAGTGKERHTMVRDLEVDAITRQILHIDFQRVLMTETVRVTVPVELQGTAEGVKNQGGVLDFITREVQIECLPREIPPKLVLDVSKLQVGEHLEAKDLALPAKVKLLDEPERVIVAVAHSRVAALEEVAEEEVLIEAEEAEPEVISRGKEQEEETEERGGAS